MSRRPGFSEAQRAHLLTADPYIRIVDDLTEAIDMLRVIYLAMSNPNRLEIWGGDPCEDVLSRALDVAEKARKEAKQNVDRIIGEAAP